MINFITKIIHLSVLGRSRIYIPTYDDLLLRVSVSLILCTTRFSLNIFDDTKVGFEGNFYSLPLLVTSLTSTLLQIFSIVLPNTLLFFSLKKSFSFCTRKRQGKSY